MRHREGFLRRGFLLTGFLLISFLLTRGLAFGQAGNATAVAVTCPATGSSIQVLAAKPARTSYGVLNDSATDIRMGFASSGTATLDDTNSIILKAGQTFADSQPNVYYGRVVCMSTTAGAIVIHVTEASR